jgi:hypothetical protein
MFLLKEIALRGKCTSQFVTLEGRFLGCKIRKKISVRIHSRDLRFMVMVPGGENKRPDVNPETSPIGLRVSRQSDAMDKILDLRRLFFDYETPKVLGQRKPATARRNAFGARHFQSHVTFLWRGRELGGDLSPPARSSVLRSKIFILIGWLSIAKSLRPQSPRARMTRRNSERQKR